MIFSGGITFCQCEKCSAEYSSVTPTSLVPIASVVIWSGLPWARVVSRFVPYRWLAFVFGFIIALCSLWCIYVLVEMLTMGKVRRGICPKCDGKLAHRGNGFYDGIMPNPWEILIYVLTLVLAFGSAVAIRHFAN
jgi:hypothetical protein